MLEFWARRPDPTKRFRSVRRGETLCALPHVHFSVTAMPGYSLGCLNFLAEHPGAVLELQNLNGHVAWSHNVQQGTSAVMLMPGQVPLGGASTDSGRTFVWKLKRCKRGEVAVRMAVFSGETQQQPVLAWM